MLAGRAAEEQFLDAVSGGAGGGSKSDLARAIRSAPAEIDTPVRRAAAAWVNQAAAGIC